MFHLQILQNSRKERERERGTQTSYSKNWVEWQNILENNMVHFPAVSPMAKIKMLNLWSKGKADSNFTTCKETRWSGVTGYVVWLEDASMLVKGGMQK